MNIEDRKCLVAFSSHYAMGPKTLKLILDNGPSKIWQKGFPSKLVKIFKVSGKTIEAINKTRITVDPNKYLKKIEERGFKTLIYGEENYPQLLYEVSPPPIVIYFYGELIKSSKAIAVVGSRKCSYYAKAVLDQILPDIVDCGITTISGMALGVDSLVHKITLESAGKTIAVLGSGIDVVYPFTNKKLYQDIAKNGLVITEFGLGMPPLPVNFPQRNRLVAGLACSLLVVEANINSGSLITARFALDYNRQVYAIPGDITRYGSRGTNNLIKLGAKPVTESSDILTDYGFISKSKKGYLPKNEIERKIYEVFSNEPLYVDKICELTKLDIVTINQQLTLMELQGVVENIGNSTYIRK